VHKNNQIQEIRTNFSRPEVIHCQTCCFRMDILWWLGYNLDKTYIYLGFMMLHT